jgi:hypothetical protein
VRAIATLPMLATPLALLWARLRLHGDRSPTAAYYGLALSFGFMTLLGFASYLLGVALMLVGLTLWLELLVAVDGRDPSSPRREIVVACFAPLLLVAHGHAFLLFLAMAVASALSTGRRAARLLRLRAVGPAVAVAAWSAWVDRAVPAGSVAPERGAAAPLPGRLRQVQPPHHPDAHLADRPRCVRRHPALGRPPRVRRRHGARRRFRPCFARQRVARA